MFFKNVISGTLEVPFGGINRIKILHPFSRVPPLVRRPFSKCALRRSAKLDLLRITVTSRIITNFVVFLFRNSEHCSFATSCGLAVGRVVKTFCHSSRPSPPRYALKSPRATDNTVLSS